MCRPSATSATDPNQMPPKISTHHCRANGDHEPHLALISLMRFAEENVTLAELIDGM